MGFTAPSSPARSAARQVHVDRRQAEQEKVERAVEAGKRFLEGVSNETYVSPREFFLRVVPEAGVDQFTAQVAFDRLASAGRMDFKIGEGIRSVKASGTETIR